MSIATSERLEQGSQDRTAARTVIASHSLQHMYG